MFSSDLILILVFDSLSSDPFIGVHVSSRSFYLQKWREMRRAQYLSMLAGLCGSSVSSETLPGNMFEWRALYWTSRM